jgi:diguanylate cyclase (GGDEF)-like protein
LESRAEVRGFLAETRSRDGRASSLSLDLLPLDGPDGSFWGHLLLVRDETRQRRVEMNSLHQAYYDPLTGLANRARLHDLLWEGLRRSRSDPGAVFAVLHLDLDRFSSVLHTLGHLSGDQLLMDVAQRLKEAVDGRARAFHLGGDQFAFLVEDGRDRQAVQDLARKVLDAFREPFALADLHLHLTACLGLAFSEGGVAWPEHFLRNAALAMHQAKSRGPGNIELYAESMLERCDRAMRLGVDLRQALVRREFHLLFQPIVELDTGLVLGFEALVRWSHPERGLLSPGEFIPLAEETELIVPLGRQVWEEACRAARALREGAGPGRAPFLTVNVSGRELREPGLPGHVAACLDQYGLPPGAVKAEVTETVLMHTQGPAAAALAELRELGLELVMDDFGTGYSSLAGLTGFPISTFKLDRAFIRHIDTRPKDQWVVRALLSLAGGLSMGLVAEGIETEAQLAVLLKLGCPLGQGYLFSRPVGLAQALELLRS